MLSKIIREKNASGVTYGLLSLEKKHDMSHVSKKQTHKFHCKWYPLVLKFFKTNGTI